MKINQKNVVVRYDAEKNEIAPSGDCLADMLMGWRIEPFTRENPAIANGKGPTFIESGDEWHYVGLRTASTPRLNKTGKVMGQVYTMGKLHGVEKRQVMVRGELRDLWLISTPHESYHAPLPLSNMEHARAWSKIGFDGMLTPKQAAKRLRWDGLHAVECAEALLGAILFMAQRDVSGIPERFSSKLTFVRFPSPPATVADTGEESRIGALESRVAALEAFVNNLEV